MKDELVQPFLRAGVKQQSGMALLITLLMLSLMTIIVLAFLGTMTWEMTSARVDYENQKARSLAVLGMNTAVAQLRLGLDIWDNPYANFATNPPTFFWSVSPGILTRWSYSSTTPLTNYPLFSTGSTNLVNLNAPRSDSTYPIAGGPNPPNISVYWANVLKNPANITADVNNPIIGRYAFWVDDENAKININTADGTLKYQTNSLGLGSPSEVSLQVLQSDPTALSPASNIVYVARTTGFNSVKEILRATNATPDLYNNNVFNMTTYSRSPDLNIFGQPKMQLTPILGDSGFFATSMAMNSITLQPAREIYPTPSQLPTYSIIPPVDPNQYWEWFPTPAYTTPTAEPWPLVFRGEFGIYNGGRYTTGIGSGGCNQLYPLANYFWINGMMLTKYLDGKNAANQSITWPAFPGASATGFAGKYTLRQIDSIAAQILDFGSKEISPDYCYSSITDFNPTGGYSRGQRSSATPDLFFGWLSHQWVSGIGRDPKVDAMELAFATYGSIGQPSDTNYLPPSATMDIWQEWWLPASYLGGNNVLPIFGGGEFLGHRNYQGPLNAVDLCQNLDPSGIPGGRATPPGNNFPPAGLPKTNYVSPSYWGNQLLANDQGIDFAANNNYLDDPDQGMAAQYHPYRLNKTLPPDGNYAGAGTSYGDQTEGFESPFSMSFLQQQGQANDWAPGEMRCLRSLFGSLAVMPMQTNAGSATDPTLNIQGGIQELGELIASSTTEPDPVPLEAIRGSNNELLNGEPWTNSAMIPGSLGTTIRDRSLASVIPVLFNMAIPGNSNGSETGVTKYVLAKVSDPLVNKFPGDWTVTVTDTPPSVPGYWSSATATSISTYSSDNEYSTGFHTALADPDSYWLPQADVGISSIGDIASQTLIPRSARFPNIGYLQYLRTGIIPDDELSLPYQWPAGTVEGPTALDRSTIQHGTPFRLLSYAPSTDTANQKTTRNSAPAGTSQPYPDWAMLDLLYVPSFLASYASPYGYYETNGVWQGYGNAGVLANNSTYGGSTPGRINPNGVVIYTTNSTVPQLGVARTVPLQAVVHGLWVNQTLNTANRPNANPGLTGGTAVDDSISESDANSIPAAIERYIRDNGPLRMPEELCNVPEIAALHSPVNATRNDLIRQIIGNLTTQSNTFSVWVAGQSISKIKGNTTYGIYESGDQISASVRYHFIVERYLDPGADGVYGNSISAGPDGISGTYDDPVDPINHPFQPHYLYRIVSSEEIR